MRQMAALVDLPTMLKTAEIASDLSVNVNTFSTYQRTIYRKHGASNRRKLSTRRGPSPCWSSRTGPVLPSSAERPDHQ